MVSRLIALLPQGLQNTDEDDIADRAPRPRLRLIPAAIQACLLLGMLSLALDPAVLSPHTSEGLTLSLFIGGLLLGALLVLISRHYQTSKAVVSVFLVAAISSQVLEACCVALGRFRPVFGEVSVLVALACSGLGGPFVLLLWSSAFALFSRGDVFLSTVVGFVLFDLFFTLVKLFPSALLSATLGCAVLGVVATFAEHRLLKRGLLASLGFPDSPSSPETEPPKERDSSDAGSGLGGLYVSTSYLGLLLCLFTAGATARNVDTEMFVLPASLGALAVLIVTTAFFVATRTTRGVNQLFFLFFDLGLPGLAVVAVAIKTIPLALISTTVFPHFMEAYFLLLVTAFWINLVSFGRSNGGQLGTACSITVISAALSLAIGFASSLPGAETGSVVLGLVTAVFLILAVVAVGYSLILYAKGTEPEAALATEPPNMSDVCRAFGKSHQLTPREIEVLEELAHGHSSSYIAKVLFISSNTARSHMKNIYRKLNVGSREELIELLRHRPPGE